VPAIPRAREWGQTSHRARRWRNRTVWRAALARAQVAIVAFDWSPVTPPNHCVSVPSLHFTVMPIGVLYTAPQLSHACTTVL
jgi:hypothetical protein